MMIDEQTRDDAFLVMIFIMLMVFLILGFNYLYDI